MFISTGFSRSLETPNQVRLRIISTIGYGIPFRTKTSLFDEHPSMASLRSLIGVGAGAMAPCWGLSYGEEALIFLRTQITTVKAMGKIKARIIVENQAL
jgi:hypothetical protein